MASSASRGWAGRGVGLRTVLGEVSLSRLVFLDSSESGFSSLVCRYSVRLISPSSLSLSLFRLSLLGSFLFSLSLLNSSLFSSLAYFYLVPLCPTFPH